MEGAQSPSPTYRHHLDDQAILSYAIASAIDVQEPCSFNLRLIEAVRDSRCLYDTKDRMYRSAEHKIKVWNRLAQHLQFDGDARTLYSRWKQLRDKYGKEKKKLKYGASHTAWQYFKHLTFLDPYMIDRQQQQYARAKEGKGVILSPGGTPHQIVVRDPEFSLNLIHEVRQHPCLYDIRDPKYRHSECRNLAWSEIIKRLNFPGDINSIYKQWKKVRDRYVREKRKMKMSRMSGGGADVSQWELFPQMIWIDPFLDDRATYYSRHIKRRKSDSDELSDDVFIDDMVDAQGQHSVHSSLAHEHSPYASLLMSPADVKSVVHLQQGCSFERTPSGNAEDRHSLLESSFMDDQQGVSFDGDKAFALSVTADLLALPEQAREIAKARIQSWLDGSSTQDQGIWYRNTEQTINDFNNAAVTEPVATHKQ